MHELKIFQFVNIDHPIMANPYTRTAHTLTYIRGHAITKYRRQAEDWIMSIPAPSLLTRTIWDDFEEAFLEDWSDVNEPYRAAADLDTLRMKNNNIDTYIT